jgi:preprotein translocase SecE subunit
MTAFNTRRNLLALLLAVVLACSLFTVGVFAGEETTTVAEESTSAEETTTAAETTEGESTEAGSTEETTEAGSTEGTTGEATTEEETTEANPLKDMWFDNNGKLNVPKIVVWALVVLGLIAGVVFCIIKREKVGEFLRALKSENKRIVWSSWKDTRKNTLVVLAVVAAITLIIALFNFALEMILGGSQASFGTSLLDLIVSLFKK